MNTEEIVEWAECDSSKIEQDLKATAYRLWEEAGRPDDRDLEFWCAAERDMFGYTVDEMSQTVEKWNAVWNAVIDAMCFNKLEGFARPGGPLTRVEGDSHIGWKDVPGDIQLRVV